MSPEETGEDGNHGQVEGCAASPLCSELTVIEDPRPQPATAAPAAVLEEVLARIATGDGGSFDAFYDLLVGKVFGLVCTVLRDGAQAKEVTQEVFMELWRTAPHYTPATGSVTSWAMAVAHRCAVDRVRSAEAGRSRERRATFESIRSRPSGEIAEGVLDGDERRRVPDCLSQLTEQQREAVHLAYYEGHTVAEIAEAKQLSANTVNTRLRDGILRLQAGM